MDTFAETRMEVFVDGTLGAAGHASGIVAQSPHLQHLVGIDQDTSALDLARSILRPPDQYPDPLFTLHLEHGNFRHLRSILDRLHLAGKCNGILLDLGVSSMQFDQAHRGFSFRFDGPLDMRMNPEEGLSAADLVGSWSEHDLATIFRDFGEERNWRGMARRLVDARSQMQIETTYDLLRALGFPPTNGSRRGGGGKSKIHPATRVFQALRIAVNDELGALDDVLPAAVDALAPGGRLGVISFHSLEDRLVKRFFLHAAGKGPRGGNGDDLWRPRSGDGDTKGVRGIWAAELAERDRTEPRVKILTKRPLTADENEIQVNPRSRTAKVRFIEKL